MRGRRENHPTLPENTKKLALENWWLGDFFFIWGFGLFSGASCLGFSFREGLYIVVMDLSL